MTATERLRELLDERGVKWERGLPTETIAREQIDALYVERPDGRMHVYFRSYLTPEQAIAATLGRGTCRDTEGSGRDFCCSECGARLYVDTGDTYTMIAADEHTIIKRPNFCPNCGAEVVS